MSARQCLIPTAIAQLPDTVPVGIFALAAGQHPTFTVGTVAFADPVQADRLAAGVVAQPDALAEQDRCDVQVDLVDQSQFEKLTADGGRGEGTSRFFPPAASSPICTASAGTQLSNVTPSAASRPRRGGGHEDRSVPGATVRAAVTYDIPTVSTPARRQLS